MSMDSNMNRDLHEARAGPPSWGGALSICGS